MQTTDFISLKEFGKIVGERSSTLLYYHEALPPAYVIAGRKCYDRADALKWVRPAKKKRGPKSKNNG